MNGLLKLVIGELVELDMQVESIELTKVAHNLNIVTINKEYNLGAIIVANSIFKSYISFNNDESINVKYFDSFSEAVDYLKEILQNQVKEGDVLTTPNRLHECTVVKHHILDQYNLLDNHTNQFHYVETVSLDYLKEHVSKGRLIRLPK